MFEVVELIPDGSRFEGIALDHNKIDRMSLAFFCETSSPPKFDSASSLL